MTAANLDEELITRFVEVGIEQLERAAAGPTATQPKPRAPRPGRRGWGSALLAAAAVTVVATIWSSPWWGHDGRSHDGRENDRWEDQRPTQITTESGSRPRVAIATVRTLQEAEALPEKTLGARLHRPDEKTLRAMKRLRRLQRLELESPQVPANELAALLTPLSSLRGIHIESQAYGELDWSALAALPVLQRLSLRDVALSAGAFRKLAKFPSLRELDIRECGTLTAAMVPDLGRIRGIHWLGFTPTAAIRAADLASLPRPQQYRTLALSSGTFIRHDAEPNPEHPEKLTNSIGLAGIRGFAQLTALSLQGLGITDDELKPILQLENLRDLNLHACTALTSDAADYFPNSLRRLDVAFTRWRNGAPLRLQQLEVINLGSSMINDAGLEAILELEGLRALDLRHCPSVTRNSIEALAGSALTELNLIATTWLRNRDVRELGDMKELRRLAISGTRDKANMRIVAGFYPIQGSSRVSGDGISALAQLTKLEWLEMEYLRPISPEDASALAKLPLRKLAVRGTKLRNDPNGPPTAWDKIAPPGSLIEGRTSRFGPRLPEWANGWTAFLEASYSLSGTG